MVVPKFFGGEHVGPPYNDLGTTRRNVSPAVVPAENTENSDEYGIVVP
jgi:hypothetical protein